MDLADQCKTINSITGGSGLTNGTYHNVKLFNTGTTTWDGATAKVTVASNAVLSRLLKVVLVTLLKLLILIIHSQVEQEQK